MGFFSFMIKLIMTVVLCVIFVKYFKPMQHNDVMTSAGVLSTVAGILFGFVLAAVSIFSSASDRNDGIIHALKKNNILQSIISKLLSTGFTLILACVFPLIAMFLPAESYLFNVSIDFLFTIIGLSLLVIAIFSFVSCWRKLTWIIPHI
ncbi:MULTISPECIES: hypothetical protein [Yersinia]|uniref:hypothetical protein n=1 Tax=Yersinia TaxID=629 RepID=UPI0005E322E6|nr:MULTISPECIES: hypothetical protein [Yersinia]UNK25139.1 hypothetical protein MNQ97_09320 [Yersinia intermedia]CNJ15096.1 Uncharacterised protein [Yersinia aldovae]